MQEKLGTKEGIKKVQRTGADTRVSGVDHPTQSSMFLCTDVSNVKGVAVFQPLSLRQHDPIPLQC